MAPAITEGGRAIVRGKDEGAVFPFSASIRDFHNATTEDGRWVPGVDGKEDRRTDGWIDRCDPRGRKKRKSWRANQRRRGSGEHCARLVPQIINIRGL